MEAELTTLDTAGAEAEWLPYGFTGCGEAYTGYFYEL
jgi:hypothetical protein